MENIKHKWLKLKKKLLSIRHKRAWKIVFGILVGSLLVLGVPMIINWAYVYGESHPIISTFWRPETVLTYYGSILASVGAIVGVYCSIRAAHKDYQEDARVRVLPFMAVTPFERKSSVNIMEVFAEQMQNKTENNERKIEASTYEEFKLERIYFIITHDGIKLTSKLNKHQEELISRAGTAWVDLANGTYRLKQVTYYSIPLEVENVGKGAAVALRIGFNRDSSIEPNYIRPITLKQGQTFYVHIFSEEPFDIVNGAYTLGFNYEDIYGNIYMQKFSVKFERDATGKEYQSINLRGKQIKLEGDEADAHP